MRITTIILALILGSKLVAQEPLKLVGQSEFWGDESMSRTIAKTLGKVASDEKVVRALLAGTTDSFFKSGLFFRAEDIRLGEFQGYPAVYYSGASLANFTRRRCRIIVAFSTTHTYTIHCFSPNDV